MAFERITIDHDRMGGLPCIRDPGPGQRAAYTAGGKLALGLADDELDLLAVLAVAGHAAVERVCAR